jgi:hypothetical protein
MFLQKHGFHAFALLNRCRSAEQLFYNSRMLGGLTRQSRRGAYSPRGGWDLTQKGGQMERKDGKNRAFVALFCCTWRKTGTKIKKKKARKT